MLWRGKEKGYGLTGVSVLSCGNNRKGCMRVGRSWGQVMVLQKSNRQQAPCSLFTVFCR